MADIIEIAGRALQIAWDEYGRELPPIVFTPEERNTLARAVLNAAKEMQPEPRETGGYCDRIEGCVCGGDLPRVRAGCGHFHEAHP